MRTSVCAVVILGVVGCATSVHGQTWEPGAARLRMEVFDGIQWVSSRGALPGERIEYRAVIDYTGTRADLFALGEVLFQPTIKNAALSSATFPWLPNGFLPLSDGNNGGPLAQYGRVSYGAVATAATNSNIITTFRHSGGSNGAPAGDWMRIAGNFVTQWPRDLSGPVPPLDVVNNDINGLLRGIACGQASQAVVPATHRPGVHNLVIFRGATTFDLSGSALQMEFSSFIESFRRWGGVSGPNEGDDRRFISWQTGPGDSGTGVNGHRTGIAGIDTAYVYIPTPGVLGVAWIGAVLATRRRR